MVLPPGERYWNGRNVRLQTWRLDPVICLGEQAIFLPAQKCPYHVTFDLDLEHTLDARWPRVHRVQVWLRSGHLPARSDGQCKFSTSVNCTVTKWQTDYNTSLPLAGEVKISMPRLVERSVRKSWLLLQLLHKPFPGYSIFVYLLLPR